MEGLIEQGTISRLKEMKKIVKDMINIAEWEKRGGSSTCSQLPYKLKQMEKYFLDIQQALDDVRETTVYSSCKEKIDRIETDEIRLNCYLRELPADIRELVDMPFAREVRDSMDYLCQIDVTKVKTDNIVGVKARVPRSKGVYRKKDVDKLTLEYFIGSTRKSADGVNLALDEYVEEYRKSFKDWYINGYMKYTDENGKLSEQEFLNLLAIKETVYKKEVGVVEDMLEDIFQATIVGLVIEGVYGKELMTKDRLSSDECSDKYKDAAIRAVTLDWGFAATGGKQAVKRIAGSMLEDVTASTGSVLVRHMNIPGKLGIACEFLTGCGISKRVGELVRNPFRKRFEFVTADGWIIEDVPIRDINPRNIKKIEKELDIAGDLKEEARRLTGVDNAGKIKIGKTVEGGSKGVSEAKYQVGAYKDIKGVEGLDAHHAGQKAAMKKLVDGYDELTAPAINVPRIGHTKRHPVRGIVSRSTKGITNARQLLARDIMELRRVYPDIPNSKLQELIEMNKKLYPEMRK